MRRTTYRILGETENTESTTISETTSGGEVVELPKKENLKKMNKEIFDDDDFYHQLLRELIARKSGDSTNPAVNKYGTFSRIKIEHEYYM